MAHYKVAPVPGYERDVLAEIRTLPLDCADWTCHGFVPPLVLV
ncbi:hypothetical protein [Thioclava sp.]